MADPPRRTLMSGHFRHQRTLILRSGHRNNAEWPRHGHGTLKDRRKEGTGSGQRSPNVPSDRYSIIASEPAIKLTFRTCGKSVQAAILLTIK
jgi:hypothetical protein